MRKWLVLALAMGATAQVVPEADPATLDFTYGLVQATRIAAALFPLEETLLPMYGMVLSTVNDEGLLDGRLSFDSLISGAGEMAGFLDALRAIVGRAATSETDAKRVMACIEDSAKIMKYDTLYNPLANFLNGVIADFQIDQPTFPKRMRNLKVPPPLYVNFTRVYEDSEPLQEACLVSRGLAP